LKAASDGVILCSGRMDQYRIGEFEAPRAEVSRLQGQAQLISAQERAALAAVGVPTSGRGIEIGCGPGFFAEGLRRDDLGRKIVGVDVDGYILREARRRLPVVRGDGRLALPFRPASFDFAYSRLFLRHVQDPQAALAGMGALVKPGGCLAAIDGSDASLLLDPGPDDFAAVAAARHEWFNRRGCSADIGHRLPGLFARAGLGSVKVKAVVLDSASVGREAFAQVVLTPFLQAAQPVRAELPGGDFGPVLEHLDARVAHEARERRSEVELRAPAVDHDPDLDTTLRGPRHRLGDAAATRVVCKEIALEPDFAFGRIDRALERRKIFGAVPEQLDPIAGTEAIHGVSVGTRALRARARRSPPARRGRTGAPEDTRSARRWRRPTARANRCDRA